MERIDELQNEISKRLAANPETGAQWAEICALENELVGLKSKRNANVATPFRDVLNSFTPFIR